MFDKAPDNYDDPMAWFRYFRFTKHLPGMEMKFNQEMERVPDAKSARAVLTTYASAAMDVVIFCGFRPREGLAQELQETFGLKPSQLMLLSVDEIAKPLKITRQDLAWRLTDGGFTISDDGLITAFKSPTPAVNSRPFPPGNRSPGF